MTTAKCPDCEQETDTTKDTCDHCGEGIAHAEKKNYGLDQARAQLNSIVEMVAALEEAGDDDEQREAAEQTIYEDPLSVEVRTDWHTLDATDTKPTHYRILLCWGGPSVQIVGELSEHGEPETAEIQYQDWFTPWTTAHELLDAQNVEALLTYARCFYFGE